MEIERKWIVAAAEVPAQLSGMAGDEIAQGYLAAEPGGSEVRLRRRGRRFWLTVKGAGGLSRQEREIELEPAQFETLWPATEGRRLQKVRRVACIEGTAIELDTYGGPLQGLIVAEVEFPDEAAASAFAAPAWFGREVTGELAYRNQALALARRPPDAAGGP